MLWLAICLVLIAGLLSTAWGVSPAAAAEVEGPSRSVAPAKKPVPRGRTGFILGLSWHPAFCETRAGRSECAGQTVDRADAKQFSLVGLWAVRNSFCKVPEALQAVDRTRDWTALPAVTLAPDIAARLAIAMPGAASGLDRHQWLRNGSCQVLEADAYFALQIRLLDAVNSSAVGALFRDRIGREIGAAEVKAAFERSFGAGAGERIKMQCRTIGDRTLVTGLTIALSANLEKDTDLGSLIQAAASTTFKCAEGTVDAAGRLEVGNDRIARAR